MRKLGILIVSFHLALLVSGSSLLYAQDFNKAAQAGLKFTDIGLSARAAGMGGAFTLIGDDANAIFHNPAGIAQVQDGKVDLTFGIVNWIADTKLNAVGLVGNLGTWGNVGVSFFNMDYGNSMGTRIDPTSEEGYVETGLLNLESFALGLSYARRLTEKFMIGASVKYAYEHLGATPFLNLTDSSIVNVENETSTPICDIGTVFYPGFKSLRFGMSIKNFTPALQYTFEEGRTNAFTAPLTFRMGAAMDVLELFGDYPDFSFLVDFELVHPRDFSKRYHLGGEFSILKILKLRAGYKFGYDEEGVSFGAGINTGNVKLDYAYGAFGIFDSVSRVSCGLAF